MALQWLINQAAPIGRYRTASATVNGKVIAAGGLISSGNTNRVDLYDPDTDAWTPKTAYPKSVRNTTGVGLGNYAYFFGGYDNTNFLTDVNRFDPAATSNPYSLMAPYPTTVNGASIGTDGSKIYIFGGYNAAVYTTACRRYDPVTNLYTNLRAKPNSCAYVGVTYYNGLFYILGGTDGTVGKTYFDVYDPANDTWVTKKAAPYPVWQNSLITVGDFIYSVGEYPAVTRVMQYDPALDTWTVNAANDYPVKVQSPIYGEGITQDFIIGGYSGTAFLTQNYAVDLPAPAVTGQAVDLGVGYTNAFSYFAAGTLKISRAYPLGFAHIDAITGVTSKIGVKRGLKGNIGITSTALAARFSVDRGFAGTIENNSVTANEMTVSKGLRGNLSISSSVAAPLTITTARRIEMTGRLAAFSSVSSVPLNKALTLSGSIGNVSALEKSTLSKAIPLAGQVQTTAEVSAPVLHKTFELSGATKAESNLSVFTLSKSFPMAGTIAATGDISAKLSRIRFMTFSAALASTVKGTISKAADLKTGPLAIVSESSGQVSNNAEISGAITGASDTSGRLLVEGIAEFGGKAHAFCSVTASLNINKDLAGRVDASGALRSDLNIDRSIGGRVASVAGNTAILGANRAMSGDLSAETNSAAPMDVSYSLGGRVDASTGSYGSLSVPHGMGGKVKASSELSGILGLSLSLGGTASASSGLSGVLGVSHGMGGQIDSQAGNRATLGISHGLGGSVGAVSNVTGDFTKEGRDILLGRIDAVSSVRGSLSTKIGMAGRVESQTDFAGALLIKGKVFLAGHLGAVSSTAPAPLKIAGLDFLGGTVSAGFGLTASLGIIKPLSGAVGSVSGVAGILGADRGMAGRVEAQTSLSIPGMTVLGFDPLTGRFAISSSASGSLTKIDFLSGRVSSASDTSGRLSAAWALRGHIEAKTDLTAALSRLTRLYPVAISVLSDLNRAEVHVRIIGQVTLNMILEIQREIALTLQIPTSLNFELNYDLSGLELTLDMAGDKK